MFLNLFGDLDLLGNLIIAQPRKLHKCVFPYTFAYISRQFISHRLKMPIIKPLFIKANNPIMVEY